MYIIDVRPLVAVNLNQKKGSCSPKDWIYPTLVIKKWFQDLPADHKKAFLPACEKGVSGTEN